MLHPDLKPFDWVEGEDNAATDWEWEIDVGGAITASLKRLQSRELSHLEFYAELIEFVLTLDVYWQGLSDERQRTTAKKVREVLRECQEAKAKIQGWARKELRRRSDLYGFRVDKDGEIYDGEGFLEGEMARKREMRNGR